MEKPLCKHTLVQVLQWSSQAGVNIYDLRQQIVEAIEDEEYRQVPDCALSTRPLWLDDSTIRRCKDIWNQPNNNNSNPRVQAIKAITAAAAKCGVAIGIKTAKEIQETYCV